MPDSLKIVHAVWRNHCKMPLAVVMLAMIANVGDARSPNVLIVLTDDQGWGDLGIHGNANLSTPHLDSIAKQGVSFQNFYVCQVCAPTRAEFLTGRYHPRTGVSGVSQGEERLNADEMTLADVLTIPSHYNVNIIHLVDSVVSTGFIRNTIHA